MIRSITLLFAALLCTAFIPDRPAQALPTTQPEAKQVYPRIVIYSTEWCGYCKKAMEYFKKHNIPFINKDIENDRVAAKEIITRYRTRGVPLIVIGKDEKILHGFDEDILDHELQKYRK